VAHLSFPVLRVRNRPLGIWLIAVPIAAEGLSFYGAAFQVMAASADDWPAALASVAIGTLLIVKVRALWSFHKTAWWSIIAFSCLGVVIDAVEIARGHGAPGIWLAVAWAVATVVYLMIPGVRALFAHAVGAAANDTHS